MLLRLLRLLRLFGLYMWWWRGAWRSCVSLLCCIVWTCLVVFVLPCSCYGGYAAACWPGGPRGRHEIRLVAIVAVVVCPGGGQQLCREGVGVPAGRVKPNDPRTLLHCCCCYGIVLFSSQLRNGASRRGFSRNLWGWRSI